MEHEPSPVPKCLLSDMALESTDYIQNHLENLLSLLQPTFQCLKFIVKILIHGPDGAGKRLLARLAAKSLNFGFHEERVADLFDENIVGTEKKVRSALTRCPTSTPYLLYLSGYELFCKLEDSELDAIEYAIRETLEDLSNTSSQPIILIASTVDFDRVYKTSLSDIFQHDLQMRPCTNVQAQAIIDSIKKHASLESDPVIDLKDSTCKYFIGNLFNLITKSEVKLYSKKISPKSHSDSVDEEPNQQMEKISWADVGGLSDVKADIIDTIQLSLDYPELRKSGLRRTGILLYGPPGTGKTLLAKAVASECGLNFINVKGPELLNEYVGQSEDNIRKLFQTARDSSPCVIFFDEIDSLAPNRGQAGDAGGVMDRMVSQLLAEMDGAGKSEGVFIIGATNRADLVDPSLLRPGRFDKVLKVDIPRGKDNRLQILRALSRKLQLDEDVDLERLEAEVPLEMSGADFQGLCSRALQRAFDRCICDIERGHSTENDTEVIVTMSDFMQSLQI